MTSEDVSVILTRMAVNGGQRSQLSRRANRGLVPLDEARAEWWRLQGQYDADTATLEAMGVRRGFRHHAGRYASRRPKWLEEGA